VTHITLQFTWKMAIKMCLFYILYV